jgi:hypothetical protein
LARVTHLTLDDKPLLGSLDEIDPPPVAVCSTCTALEFAEAENDKNGASSKIKELSSMSCTDDQYSSPSSSSAIVVFFSPRSTEVSSGVDLLLTT